MSTVYKKIPKRCKDFKDEVQNLNIKSASLQLHLCTNNYFKNSSPSLIHEVTVCGEIARKTGEKHILLLLSHV